MVQNLTELYDKLDVISSMLEADRQDVLGPAPNLLAIHHQLTQLEAFRNQMMLQAKSASADDRNTLSRYFQRLNKELAIFEDYIWDIARNILPIVRAGNGTAIVKLVKIAEVEGREDEKVFDIWVCGAHRSYVISVTRHLPSSLSKRLLASMPPQNSILLSPIRAKSNSTDQIS